jgi:antitoxin (DNA-binding transcriptional repressor) of toxin-antitoxin stability system
VLLTHERISIDLVLYLVYYLVMSSRTLNMHDAKTHLSGYIARLKRGERIILCRRNIPVAEIRPLPKDLASDRPRGLLKGAATIPPAFWDPLPEDLQSAFDGRHE